MLSRACLLLLALTCAACLPEGASTCADGTVCPGGYRCGPAAGPACVAPGQFEACLDRADGEPCEVGGIGVGACRGGVCVAVACGNGFIDDGELCDDGNRLAGDGCNEFCTSREVCGNGVADLAAAESCDCGGPERYQDADGDGQPDDPAPGCTGPNSANPESECSLACGLRHCGDNVVSGIEECDSGSFREGASCEVFGFYRGVLACTELCRIDVAACDGRCGDGAVDSERGEACDGLALGPEASCEPLGYYSGTPGCTEFCQLTDQGSDATCDGQCGDGEIQASEGELCDGPTEGYCAQLGFDAGRADCSSACGFDLSTCQQFGWDRITYDTNIYSHWSGTRGVRVIAEYEAWIATVFDGEARLHPAAQTHRVTGTDDGATPTAYGIHAYDPGSWRYRPGEGFTILPARPSGTNGASHAQAIGADELWVTTSEQVEVWDGSAWSSLSMGQLPSDRFSGVFVTPTSIYVAAHDYTVYRSVVFARPRAGGDWTRHVMPSSDFISFIDEVDGEVVISAGSLFWGLSNPTQRGGSTSVAVYGASAHGLVGRFAGYDPGTYDQVGIDPGYWGTRIVHRVVAPPGRLTGIDDRLYSIGGAYRGLAEARDAMWSPIDASPDFLGSGGLVAVEAGATAPIVVRTATTVLERGRFAWRTRLTAVNDGLWGACRLGNYLYVTRSSGLLQVLDNNNNVVASLNAGRAPQLVCLEATGEVVTVSWDGIARGTGTNVSFTPGDHSFFRFVPKLAANAAGTIIAAQYDGTIYRLDGTTFTQLATVEVGTAGCTLHYAITGCIEGLAVLPSGEWIAVSRDRIARGDGTRIDSATLGNPGLRAVTAITADDIWAVGGDDAGTAAIWHWDGAAWSPVRPPSSETILAVSGSVDDVMFATSSATYALLRPNGP